ERPRYLLLLGDADLVSWDLHQRLASDLFVGRLAFPDDQGYEAYAAKVLRWEQQDAVAGAGARALFYAMRDGTAAMSIGHAGLMAPSLDAARSEQGAGNFAAQEIVELGEGASVSMDELLAAASSGTPTMLFTMSHGLGAPRGKGWASVEEQ